MTRADRGKPGWSARHEEIERIGEKLIELWLCHSKLTLEQLVANVEPNFNFHDHQWGDLENLVPDEDFEWALDHYNDDPPTGN